MSGSKGMTGAPGLLYFALVVAITIAVVYLVSLVPFIEKLVSIRSEARFAVWQDDQGTGLAAFMASDTGNGSYAELLGLQAAKGVEAGSDSSLRAVLERMEPRGRLALLYGGVKVKEYGTVGESNYLQADLALPGLKKGEVRVS